jgi:outer membrane protein assembly factor BamB
MIAYCNLHGGTGKPLWEITLGEYSIWFQVCCASSNNNNRGHVADYLSTKGRRGNCVSLPSNDCVYPHLDPLVPSGP